MIDEDAIRQRWEAVGSQLDERGRRLFAAGEVRTAGWGGLAVVSKITGLARSTINRGEDDIDQRRHRAQGVGETRVLAPHGVILTHLHFDHIAGLVAGGRKTFPNAEVYADRRDVTFWTDPARRTAAPDFLKSSFDISAEVIRLYPQLNRIDGEREIAGGVSIVDLTGHTPGHIGVRIADAGESLIMVSDMLFHPAVHPAAVDIGFIFEQDPPAARQMREKFFPRAAEDKALIAATYIAFPGLGRIAKDGGALRWVTAEWAHQG